MIKIIVGTVGVIMVATGLSLAVLHEPKEAKKVYRDILEYRIICKKGFLYYDVRTATHGGGLSPILNSKNEVQICD